MAIPFQDLNDKFRRMLRENAARVTNPTAELSEWWVGETDIMQREAQAAADARGLRRRQLQDIIANAQEELSQIPP